MISDSDNPTDSYICYNEFNFCCCIIYVTFNRLLATVIQSRSLCHSAICRRGQLRTSVQWCVAVGDMAPFPNSSLPMTWNKNIKTNFYYNNGNRGCRQHLFSFTLLKFPFKKLLQNHFSWALSVALKQEKLEWP